MLENFLLGIFALSMISFITKPPNNNIAQNVNFLNKNGNKYSNILIQIRQILLEESLEDILVEIHEQHLLFLLLLIHP